MADDNSFTSSFDISNVFNADDSITDEVKSHVDKLKAMIENKIERHVSEEMKQILEQCLIACPKEFLDEKVFSKILPAVHLKQIQVLKDVNCILNNSEERNSLENIKEKLLISEELLYFWEKCVEHIIHLHQISVANIGTLPDLVLDMIKLIFEHCKTSCNTYGIFFDETSKELTSLFRKTNVILKLFLTTLEGIITFDTDVELETRLLVKVIKLIGVIAIIANGMDLKLYVETSKIFGKLAVVYQNEVKRVLVTSVTINLIEMVKNISYTLSKLKDYQSKIDERTVKATSLLLKILDKLINIYNSYLTNEFFSYSIELLVYMQRCIPSALKIMKINGEIINIINTHITIGMEPLLNTLFKNTGFMQAYFEYRNQSSMDELGFHLLTVNIIKKLIAAPYDCYSNWTLKAESIIDVTLTNINCIQEELSLGELQVQGACELGQKPRLAGIYEATLVPISALISRVPSDQFYAIELILLKHLLDGQLWSSLLSSDIWCFIGRNRCNNIETIVLENLIGRLYTLLPEDTKHSIIAELIELNEPDAIYFWIPIIQFLPCTTRSFLCNHVVYDLDKIPEIFGELFQQRTARSWNYLTTLISTASELRYTGKKEYIEMLLKMWNFIAKNIEDYNDKQLDIISDLSIVLSDCINPKKLDEEILLSIIEIITVIPAYLPSHVKIKLSFYLRDHIDQFDSCNSKTATMLANLNCDLLQNENPWIRQNALESFDYIAHICSNEDLVRKMANVIVKKHSISNAFRAYISNTQYYKLEDFTDDRSYLRSFAKILKSTCKIHICRQYNDVERNEKFPKIEIRKESSEQNSMLKKFDCRANEICNALNEILSHKDDVSTHVLQKLRIVLSKILEFEQ